MNKLYLVKDRYDCVFLYGEKPIKREDLGFWIARDIEHEFVYLGKNCTDLVSWDDPNPLEVKIVNNIIIPIR